MKYLFLIGLSVLSLRINAQQKHFSVDDNGKFIYYQIVDSSLVAKDSLISRAKYFINVLNKKAFKIQSVTDSSILANGKTIIDKTVLVSSHPSGEISYKFIFEAREGKCRFWLTNFEYIPYERDRYGNFVLITNFKTPLEKTPDKLSAKEWNDIVERSFAKTEQFGVNFRKFLTADNNKKFRKHAEIIITKKW